MIKGCGGIILKDGKVLLLKRRNASSFNNMWANPGGKIGENEEIEKAVIREIEEEIGVQVKIIKKIGTYWDKKDTKIIGEYVGYIVEIIKGNPRIIEKHKAEKMEYFELDNLPEETAEFTKFYLKNL